MYPHTLKDDSLFYPLELCNKGNTWHPRPEIFFLCRMSSQGTSAKQGPKILRVNCLVATRNPPYGGQKIDFLFAEIHRIFILLVIYKKWIRKQYIASYREWFRSLANLYKYKSISYFIIFHIANLQLLS